MGRRVLRSIFVSDMVALVVAIWLATWIVFGTPLPWQAAVPQGESLLPFSLLLFAGAVIGSYLSARSWANSAPRPLYGRAFGIVLFAASFTAIGLVVTRVYWSRPLFGWTVVIWFALVVIHRAIRRRRPWSESMVIITDEKQLAEDIRATPHATILSVLGPADEPPVAAVDMDVSLVVDLRSVLSEDMAQFVASSSIAGQPIRTLSHVYEEHTGRLAMVHLAEGWEVSQPVARSGYAPVKRVIDVVAVVLTLPVWILLGAIVWLVVKFDSRGPAIYSQERIGRNGRAFTLYKYRTMIPDAEPNGPAFARVGDPRLTRVGGVLRKTRLDEIPQLWNVFVGDLSLVGPRPERPLFVEQFERTIPFYSSRTLIRPGVTGWAQVNYGYADDEAETVEKLTYDLYYVKNSSVWLDLHILFKSVWTVSTGSGAR
jgi:exopolysaccharide biosynthesis polyprenyl glycosylphosphotransferase